MLSHITALLHSNGSAGSFENDDMLYNGCTLNGFIADFLQFNDLAVQERPIALYTTRDMESSFRPRRVSVENPPYTTECRAPIFAHASIAK
jgi:hypothetical protein